jgi:hypothetical protein
MLNNPSQEYAAAEHQHDDDPNYNHDDLTLGVHDHFLGQLLRPKGRSLLWRDANASVSPRTEITSWPRQFAPREWAVDLSPPLLWFCWVYATSDRRSGSLRTVPLITGRTDRVIGSWFRRLTNSPYPAPHLAAEYYSRIRGQTALVYRTSTEEGYFLPAFSFAHQFELNGEGPTLSVKCDISMVYMTGRDP